jgi:outer membrane protein OmpA-like peptidoglycan-associated protein
MKTYIVTLIALLCFGVKTSVAQEDRQPTSEDSIVVSSWMIGLDYNIVDDSGDVFHELFSIDSQWNALPYPSRLSIGRYFKSGFGIEAIASYNSYKTGKIIDGVPNGSDKPYLGMDTRLSYDVNKLIGETAWLDPYIGLGVGYTDANEQGRATYNAIIGFRTWFSDHWGMDFSSSGKWSFGTAASNHIQHAAGIVYRFGLEKELSKRGVEKLALQEEIEKQKQQVNDSIDKARRAEKEAAALADRLAREKEASRLAADEKAKIDAEIHRRKQVEDAISGLGNIYFDLNSSYLNEESKSILDQLARIALENPSLTLNITSHADSRGLNAYNNWLSQRRAKRTIDYLVSKGIGARRLQGEGRGEEQLTNHCRDGVGCTEKQHRANRRSEFGVSDF